MRNPSSPTVTRIAIPPLLTTASCGVGTLGIVSEQKPRTTERRDQDSYRSSDKDCEKNRDREHDRSKKGDIQHGSEQPHERSPQCKDQDGECTAAPTSTNVRADMRVRSMTAKQSRGMGPALVHRMAAGGHTPPNVNRCRLHPFHIQHL